MIKLKRTKGELIAKFDTAKSFYNKAQFEEVETNEGNKIYLLYSYGSLVCGIVAEKDGTKWLYLNNKIQNNLLLSKTTLRHIKEFYKQFYKNETRTKADIVKLAIIKNFDFLEVYETNNSTTANIAEYKNYYNCTSPETTKFFKGFKGYRQTQKQDSNGKYLYTKSIYGYSNYYFYYI